MIDRNLKNTWHLLLCLICLVFYPFRAHSVTPDQIDEKRISVAMRMIGHQVLEQLGDDSSRVMPIEQMGQQFRIPFEFEFGFDPSDIVAIVDNVISSSGIASDYLVEVEQCTTKKIVHSFEVQKGSDAGMIPCIGRAQPKDCYSILFTILAPLAPPTSPVEDAVSATTGSTLHHLIKFSLQFGVLLLLLVIIGFYLKRTRSTTADPNVINIGTAQFDKLNMALLFGDHRIDLSNKEAQLLTLLHTSVNTPIKREVILQRVWGNEGDYVGRTLDVFISKLRKKLEGDASVKIVNVRGVGYKLVMNPSK